MPLFLDGAFWVPIKHNVALAEAYIRTKWHVDDSSRLATTYMGRPKIGVGCAAHFGEELGLNLTQCGLAKAYFLTKWHLDPSSRLATTNGPKTGCVPFSGGVYLCPYLTQCGMGPDLPP